jgi:4-hydroxy-3-methylbut-2-enyl diphosphate reductase
MEVILAEKAGFCFGVQRAINTAFKAAGEGRVYCLGPIIHNPQEVARLKDAGVETIEDFSGLKPGDSLIIRSHGVPPTVLTKAREQGLTIIDLTCPFVAKAQQHADMLRKEGYQIVVVGEKKHPEVQSILGYAGENSVVVETPEDMGQIQFQSRLGVVAQTTQSYGNFSEIVLRLLRLSKELKVFNTICSSTKERQDATRLLASRVDVMFVVGGRNSANTSRLVSLCREAGKEIRPEWLKGVGTVGVTAGASTPSWVIDAVLKRLQAGGK